MGDYYSILLLPKDASDEEIRRAYKSLVMRWHPDKNPQNRLEAEAKFKAISQAYEVLGDKEKRSMYYSGGGDGGEGISSPNDEPIVDDDDYRHHRHRSYPKSMSSNMNGKHRSAESEYGTVDRVPSASLSSSFWRNGQVRWAMHATTLPSALRRKPSPVERKLECTLEELFCGCVKKIPISRDVVRANGRIEKEEEILKIKVKPGWKKGTEITFEGMGDERPGALPTDVVFLIAEKPHPFFKREGNDLVLARDIPLVKALTGCTLSVPLLGGEKISLYCNEIIFPGYEKVIKGQGMPILKENGKRGDLRIKFHVEFPSSLSPDQRVAIQQLLIGES
ncbi:hypothetical protein AMTRI_Chr11g156420 [Amborella trichopoda]